MIDFAEVELDPDKPSCEVCFEINFGNHWRFPPCDKCRPGLFPSNTEAAEILFLCLNQTEVVGRRRVLRLEAVRAAIEMRGVRDPQDCFEKVTLAFNYLSNRFSQGDELGNGG